MLKAVAKKLTTTRHKVSRRWGSYRRKKHNILVRKRLSLSEKKQILISELDLTRHKISEDFKYYQEEKYSIIHKSPYKDFKFIRKLTGIYREVTVRKVDPKTGKRNLIEHVIDPKTGKNKIKFCPFNDSYQKIYKAKRGFDVNRLDDVVGDLVYQSKVTGVLVVFEITSIETDETIMVSNYINKEEFDRIQELNETVFEYVSKKLQYGDTKTRDLKFIYMRIIYKKHYINK